LDLHRALWSTRPKTNRLAYYSFLAKKGLGRRNADFGKDVVVEYDGLKFIICKGFSEALYSVYVNENEPETCRYMTSQTGDTFVDVGANVGGYTVRLAARFAKVISVEPNPKAAKVLKKNIELNQLSNVTVYSEAISDGVGEATMYVPSSGKTTRSSIIERYGQGESFPVHTTTLDSLLEGYDRIDLLKVDAEGAEVRILEGGEKTLQRTSKLVLELGSWSEKRIMDILSRYNFKTFDLDLKAATGKNLAAEGHQGSQ